VSVMPYIPVRIMPYILTRDDKKSRIPNIAIAEVWQEWKAKQIATAHARQGYTVAISHEGTVLDVYPPSKGKGK
jgi:hypothetical protein